MFLLHSFQISNVVVVTVVVGVCRCCCSCCSARPHLFKHRCNSLQIIIRLQFQFAIVYFFNILLLFVLFFLDSSCVFYYILLIKLGSYLYHSFLYLNGYCFYSYSQFLFSLHLVFLFNCCAYCLSWIIIGIRIPFHKLS